MIKKKRIGIAKHYLLQDQKEIIPDNQEWQAVDKLPNSLGSTAWQTLDCEELFRRHLKIETASSETKIIGGFYQSVFVS